MSDWAREMAMDLYLRNADVSDWAAALREAEERGENVQVEFRDIADPGLFKVVGVMAYVGYSGPAEAPHVSINVSCTDDNMSAAHPGIEALMLSWAKECGEGVEKGLEILHQNALEQLAHHKRTVT